MEREKAPSTAASDFVRISLALYPLLPLLRIYEYVALHATHALPTGAVGLTARGLLGDLVLPLWLAAALAIPVLLPAAVFPVAARQLHRTILVAAVVLAVVCVEYFAVTFTPLGAEVFGYSAAAIRKTAMSSQGIAVHTLLPVAAFGALTWSVTGRARRFEISRGATAAFATLTIASVLFRHALTLTPASFVTDRAYFVADNKALAFARSSSRRFAERTAAETPTGSVPEFPLLHMATNEDVLGPLFNHGTDKPNLVFIIVEGLGRDFVGSGARYGGFTPFLDSLAARSLFWENFLSTSGRTFGLVPSLFGSLPFGTTGFMDLAPHGPNHLTLLGLLGARGYTTEYFSGTDGHFDNLDVFMQHERIGRFNDGSSFPPRYVKEPGELGFSWGYGDQDVFKRSLEIIGVPGPQPRLDVYQTVTTHEPFLPPRPAEYRAKFEARLAALPIDAARQAEFRMYAGVFETLLYLDDGIRAVMSAYATRADVGRTIFVITGDHRLDPIPEESPIDRFRVPFIVASAMIRSPRRFASVSSHLDVTPTLLAMLHHDYGMTFPDTVAWLGAGIDTAAQFRNIHSLAMMRTKNTVDDFLDGDRFLSNDRLYHVDRHLALSELDDSVTMREMHQRLERFRAVNRFVSSGNHLLPGLAAAALDTGLDKQNAEDKAVFASFGLSEADPARAFAVARQEAFAGRYDRARAVIRTLLQRAPNNDEWRAFYARTYAWQRRFSEARALLHELQEWAPEYPDGYAALIDVEVWSGQPATGLAIANGARTHFPRNVDILLGKVKALEVLGRLGEARAVLDTAQAIEPANPDAREIRRRIGRP